MNVITFDSEVCHIACPAEMALTELAMSLEFASNNFLGRGVYRWSVERTKSDSGSCVVEVCSLCEPKDRAMQISQVAQLGGAIQNKVIPVDIPLKESFRFGMKEEHLAQDGQNRLRRLIWAKNEGWTESIIESHDVNPDVQLAMLSYGFADLTVGLFALGVRSIKYQLSRKLTQLYIKHKLEDSKLVGFFQQQGSDYPIHMKVGKLS